MRSVRFRNVPAFVEAEGLLAEGLRADVAFGGAFYASVASPLPVRAAQPPAADRARPRGQGEPRGAAAVRPSRGAGAAGRLRRHLLGARGYGPAAPAAERDGLRRRRGRPLALRQRHLGHGSPSSSAQASSRAARSSSTKASPAREFRARVVGDAEVAGRAGRDHGGRGQRVPHRRARVHPRPGRPPGRRLPPPLEDASPPATAKCLTPVTWPFGRGLPGSVARTLSPPRPPTGGRSGHGPCLAPGPGRGAGRSAR